MTLFYAIVFYCVQPQFGEGQCFVDQGQEAYSTIDRCMMEEARAYLGISMTVAPTGLYMPEFQFECRAVEFKGQGA